MLANDAKIQHSPAHSTRNTRFKEGSCSGVPYSKENPLNIKHRRKLVMQVRAVLVLQETPAPQ
jgi:hypothetical protein